MAKKLIMLDRDGVINELHYQYVKSIKNFEFIPQSEKALCILLRNKKNISICSNQRGVSRGMVTMKTLKLIEAKINKTLPKKTPTLKFYYCTHSLDDNCNCRKPKPGLLEKAMIEAGATKNSSVFVGDNVSDYHAARNAGVRFALILTGYGKLTAPLIPEDIPRYKNLYEFALNGT